MYAFLTCTIQGKKEGRDKELKFKVYETENMELVLNEFMKMGKTRLGMTLQEAE